VTDSHLAGWARWRQPVIPETGNREETTMHPATQYLMQARHHDRLRSAARQRLAAHVKAAQVQAARRARRDGAAVAPGLRVLQLVRRLLAA
jgi:hypothetical protein